MRPVFDLHCDFLLRAVDHGIDLLHPPRWPQVTIPAMRAGGVQDQVFAIWVNRPKYPGVEGLRRAFQMLDAFREQMARHSDHIALARSEAEARAIRSSGRIAAWLWIEGAEPILDDLAALRTWHHLGVRGMTLTWNDNLPWAGSSADAKNPHAGLSEFGRDIVREMNRLGMVIDVSHASDETVADALATSAAPIIASHSCCRALCAHARNLGDDLLAELGRAGGVIGIAALPSYLRADWDAAWDEAERRAAPQVAKVLEAFHGDTSNPEYREERRLLLQAALAPESVVTLAHVLDHIEHALRVAGPGAVALGSDFDGIWAFPVGLEKASCWQAVGDGLRARGWGEEIVQGVLAGNARRVFAQAIDAAGGRTA